MPGSRWFESDPTWPTLARHEKNCELSACGCHVFVKQFDMWSKDLPANCENSSRTSDGSDTWLWFYFTKKNRFRWMCLSCHGEAELQDKHRDLLNENAHQSVQLSNLKYHNESSSHRRKLAEFLGAKMDDLGYVAPSENLFRELLQAFRKGGTPTGGYDLPSGKVAVEKANAMLWCINEGHGDTKRDHLRKAETLNIIRDERHSRMHIRYRCIGGDEPDVNLGYFGQSRGHEPDAIGLTDGTVNVYRNVCTSRANAPKGAVVTPFFDKPLFDHSRSVTEAVSIDSAENEVVSVKDMSARKVDGSDPDFENASHILRDAVHSSRRVLSRLFKACPRLNYAFNFFGMIASIIQWSDDHRRLYQSCTDQSSDAAVSTQFQHLRAAKHRIETHLTPLSRCCLDPSGEHSLSMGLYDF